MFKQERYYLSHDKKTRLHALYYLPEDEIRAILQISHGMCEYIEYYEPVAAYLSKQGILVCGNDHLGHGDSVTSEADYGYFCSNRTAGVMVEDLHELTLFTKKQYPDVPYFLLGYSMGSFLVRLYLCRYGADLNGAIIMSTGSKSLPLLYFGRFLCHLLACFKGWHYRSRFINKLSMDVYNKKFEPSFHHKDWLSSNEMVIKQYFKDEKRNFIFTLNGFDGLFSFIIGAQNKKEYAKIPKDLPLYFLAGGDDPVGHYTKDVRYLSNLLTKNGLQKIACQYYPGNRHELFTEPAKDQVLKDVLEFVNSYE